MKNKKSIIIMIIIIVLILAVISGIFMYNKFQQQELKQLTEEANKLLKQDLINDEIDNEIKTNKNYAIVEKTIKEYLTNIKNTYLEIEQLNSALDADKVFSASNVEDKAFKNVDNLTIISNTKKYLESNSKYWSTKDGKLFFQDINIMTGYYNLRNELDI